MLYGVDKHSTKTSLLIKLNSFPRQHSIKDNM